MKYFLSILSVGIFWCIIGCNNASRNENSHENGSDGQAGYRLNPVAEGLISPVGLENAGDGSGRLFILEQPGIIRVVENGILKQTPFLDLSGKVVKLNNAYAESGLLGLAFHPGFKNNGRFFVYYSAPSAQGNHQSVISEFKVSSVNRNIADTSEKVILTIAQPEWNHNGGQLTFGPDGMLYIGVGDGGGAGDKHGKIGNAQNLNNLLGKILRINVDKGTNYEIPSDNPFVQRSGVKKEIYAYGLRNPWRFSFDPVTKRLIAGDVGQNEYEEISIIEKGRNYGWRYLEGFHVFDEDLKDLVKDSEPPVYEYSHDFGKSVTGGYVYRGKQLEELQGRYIFGDWNGKLLYLTETNGQWKGQELPIQNKEEFWLNSFGVDEDGELYLVTQNKIGAVSETGVIYKLVKK